jgi:predicted O-methyltransferase YrrM
MKHKTDILTKLNLKDPYKYIQSLNLLKTESPSWGGQCDIFSQLIDEYKPRIIFELGAFLGDSTITMAKHLKKNKLDCTIITIDTWLGSQEHWIQNKCNLLHLYDNFEYGTSSLYNKFIANVIHENVEEYIIPMPATTDTAFDVLFNLGIKADMIYMDADHRESVVYNDLVNYSKLLNNDGIIFGHDINWQGVEKAVIHYCEENKKNYKSILDNKSDRIKFWQIL